MFAAIAAEDRYRFDLESKAYAFSLAASYRSANTNWPLTCCPVRCITILTP
jgi:hypothetical protein